MCFINFVCLGERRHTGLLGRLLDIEGNCNSGLVPNTKQGPIINSHLRWCTNIFEIAPKQQILPTRNFSEPSGQGSVYLYHGHFGFTQTSFRVKTIPDLFPLSLQVIIVKDKWQFSFVYLDEILLFLYKPDDHIDHAQQVMTLFRNACLALGLKTCKFFGNCISYTGHFIRPVRLEVSSRIFHAIQGLQHREAVINFQSFLNIYYVFLYAAPNFAHVSAPLHNIVNASRRPFTDMPALKRPPWRRWNRNKRNPLCSLFTFRKRLDGWHWCTPQENLICRLQKLPLVQIDQLNISHVRLTTASVHTVPTT